MFREHVDRQFVEPVFVLAEHLGDVGDGEDVRDGGQDQAARLMRASYPSAEGRLVR